MIKLTNLMICLILVFAVAKGQTSSQQPQPGKPDRFSDLVLDATTPEMAIKILGQPASEKMDKLDVSKLGKWLDPKHDEKIFRQLHFKQPGPSFSAIDLSFFEDKLVMIVVSFKKEFLPAGLETLFGVRFVALGGPVSMNDTPGLYPTQAFFATAYPASHGEIGISDKSFIYAYCVSGDPSTRGRVETVRLVSRTLEDKTKLKNRPADGNGKAPAGSDYQVCIGKIIAFDPKTNQLSVSYEKDGKTETFVGEYGATIYRDLPNGRMRKLEASDVQAGTPIKVYYRKEKRKVNGVPVIINRILHTDDKVEKNNP